MEAGSRAHGPGRMVWLQPLLPPLLPCLLATAAAAAHSSAGVAAGGDFRDERVANQVAALDADIVNTVEVQGCVMLHQMVVAMDYEGQRRSYTPFVVSGTDRATRQQVGMTTRLSPQILPLQREEGRSGQCPAPLAVT